MDNTTQSINEEDYQKLKKEILDQIIEYTKEHTIECKICGSQYKQKRKPLIKTEDGYICSECKKKIR